MMCNVLTYEQIDRNEWSRLAASSSTSTWFQTPEAYDFYASQPELFKPFVIGVTCDPAGTQTHLRAVCVGYVTVERNPIKQYFTRRAIVIGGPALADDATDEEVMALMNAVKNLPSFQGEELCSIEGPVDFHRMKNGVGFRPIYIEMRNFNDYSRWKEAFTKSAFEYVPHLNFHVDTSSVETVEANLGKSRKRDIKTSIRDGAQIIDLANDINSEFEREKMVHEYYEILSNLYKTKVKTPLFPESFFQALAKHPDGRFLLVALPKEDGTTEIIGGTVCVAQEGKCLYEWFVCGRDGEWKSIFPSSFATYAGIMYAADHGMSRFDMMGAGTPNEAYGVRDFKARFGGKEVEHGRFLCVTKPILYKIGALGVKLLKRLK